MLETVWIILGFIAQAMFFLRFFVQWIASERAGKSVIPVVFWYLSMAGGVLLLSYAVYRKDPVFIVGQSTGILIYTRNLFLVHRERKGHVASTA